MKPFFVITGMHRSGTSFLARALNLSGVYLGNFEELDTGFGEFKKSNPMGQWEIKRIISLSDKILEKNNGRWDEPPTKIILDNNDKNEFKKIENELMTHRSLASGFKDPRSLTYFESLDFKSDNIVIVGIFRDPLKVAESLKKRDRLSYEKSLKLWNFYNEKLLHLLENYQGFLLNFDWDKKRLISEIKRIASYTGLVENIDLMYWFKDELLRSDKTFESKYPLDKGTADLFEKLKDRSNKNNFSKNVCENKEDISKLTEQLIIDINKNNQFFQQVSEKNFEIIKKIKNESVPISELLVIYYNRGDLRQKFPEVMDGEYNEFVKWARYILENQIEGERESIEILKRHQKWYEDFLLGDSSKNKHFVIDDLKRKEAELQESLLKKESQTDELKRKEAELQESLLKKESQTDELKRKEAELQESLLKKESQVDDLLKLIKNKENETQKIKTEIKTLDRKLKLEIVNIENQLNSIRNSRSHKITRSILNKIDANILPNKILGPILRKIISQNEILTGLEGDIIDEKNIGYIFDDFIDEEKLFQYSLMKKRPRISIVMPVYNTNPELLERAINSVKSQYYDNWQLCICDDGSNNTQIKKILKDFSKDERIQVVFSKENCGISIASNNALQLADGEYVTLLDHDDELAKNALYEVVKTINDKPNVDFIYSDEDKIDQKGNHVEPFYKPDWSPDLFFSYNYPIHVSVFKTSILKEIGGFRKGFEGGQDYDLILRYVEKGKNIVHIPKILYSWRKISGSTALDVDEKSYAFEAGRKAIEETIIRRKINAKCVKGVQRGTYRVKYELPVNPLVSILIPSRTIQNIKVCIKSILEKSTYRNFELMVLDTSNNEQISEYCKNKKIKSLKIYLPKFNFSKINNDGVKNSNGEYIIFLNDDTKVISKDWIEDLLEHTQREEIGITGSKLIYDDNRVQHAGTIIGINGLAGNYGGMDRNEGGYFSLGKVIRNCGAVTAGCMMIEKKLFTKIGGFDEELANSWQDVDLCLRVLEYGKLIVYTPYSMLYHYEGKTRGRVDTSIEEQKAMMLFEKKHKDAIELGDRFYNPNLSLTHPYEIQNKLNEPLQILFDLYLKRKDLQQEFPNEIRNKFRNLIDWTVTNGIITDNEKENLMKYYEYYYDICSSNAKILAKKFKLFLENKKLQEQFPEVFNGKFENFLEYSNMNTKTQKTAQKT